MADSIGKSFGENEVLKSATVWATPGRVSVIMGRNGSGKTTLLRTALGLYRLDFGIVRYDDVTTTRPHLWKLAAGGVFYLPDRGLLSGRRSLGEQFRLLLERFPEADATGVAERLGISGLLDRTPGEMSGGERRKADIALAVARRPRCLLADEPLTEVEPKDRALVLELFRELATQGCALLVTGHEVHDLLDLADELVWMVAGTTHALGSPDEARARHEFRMDYLGPRG